MSNKNRYEVHKTRITLSFMTIPNILTLLRIALIPVLCLLIYGGHGLLAFGLYVFCAVTDFFDGYLARKMNAITPFGTFLDPIADKIFVAILLLVLVDIGSLSGFWVIPVIVIFLREFLVSGLREFLGPKNVTLPVTQLAKWKTTVQMLALGLLILAPLSHAILFTGQISLLIAALLTAITGWSYCKEGFKHMK